MKQYKKTLLGSMITFVVGTSCCWMSSLAIWLGGIAFVGTLSSLIQEVQVLFIGLGILLLLLTVILYVRRKRKKVASNNMKKPENG